MPSLKNVWIDPTARIVHDDDEMTVVEVTGMLCEWG
jgi:hypothetical protein